jgi:hypothetical protein
MAKATRHGAQPSEVRADAFVAIDKNVYWSTTDRAPEFSTSHTDAPEGIRDLAEWRELGYDVHSVVADPLFVDAAAHDYRLQPDSPARAMGIDSIDAGDVGLRGGPQWTGQPARVRLRDLDPASPFTPTRLLSLDESYEDRKVGFVPNRVHKTDRAKGATVAVTDAFAAAGRHSLRFADAPGLEQAYHPNRVWRDLRVESGTVRVGFDCMNGRESPATFLVELRDWSGDPLRAGPRLQFHPNGQLHVGRERRLPYEPGRWYHVEIAFAPGKGAPKSFALSFGPTGEPVEPIRVPYVDRRFNVLTWIGLLAMDRDRKSEFYVDNLKIDMR